MTDRQSWFSLSAARIFFFALGFVLAVGSILQFFIIPATSLHAGDGLLRGGDWVYFHQLARDLTGTVQTDGWSHWTLRPEGQAPAGVAALVYATIGFQTPWTLLPLNGALYGIIAVCLYRIGYAISGSPAVALMSLTPLFFLPSLAMVYGQIHKDIWAIAGVLCVLTCWTLSITDISLRGKHLILITVALLIANSFIFMVRPYALQISLFGQGAMFGLLLLGWPYHRRVFAVATGAVAIAISGLFFLSTLSHSVEEVTEAPLCVPWEQTLPIASLDRILACCLHTPANVLRISRCRLEYRQ